MTAVAAPLAVLLAAVSAAVGTGGTRSGVQRLGAALPPPAPVIGGSRRAAVDRHRLAAPVAGLAAAALLGGRWGLVAGPLAAVLVHRWMPGEAARAALARDRVIRRAAPVACDLLAAMLAAGVPVPAALRTAVVGTGGPLGEVLTDVAASLDLGAPPEEAWAPAERSPPLRPLARAAVRSATSGAALAATLTAVADDLRDSASAEGMAAARRAGVRIVGPLTLCFLPAFVLIGVVPAVVGLLPGVLR